MSNSLDILHIVAEAGYMVQLVLLLLLFFSLTSWTIILIKFLYMRRAFRQSEAFTNIFWESRDLSLAYKEASLLDGSPIARLFSIGYAELKKLRQSGGKSTPDDDSSPRSPPPSR